MIALYKGTSAVSRLIRWGTWSEYSHAAWLDTEADQCIEAWKGGVRATTLHERHTPGTPVDVFSVRGETHEHRTAIRYFLQAEVGKPYDYLGILGFVLRRPLARQTSWFCSELVFAAYAHAGLALLERVPAHKVSPGMLARSPLLERVWQTTTLP